MMRKADRLVLAMMLFLTASCSGDRLYEDFIAIPSQSWGKQDSIKFELKQLDISGSKSLIGIRFNEEYAFSNCYLRVISKDSLGQTIENRLVNMPLFESKSGKPLGKGFGSTFTQYDTLPFLLSGNPSEIILLQYMREEQLKGIEAVGLKVLKPESGS